MPIHQLQKNLKASIEAKRQFLKDFKSLTIFYDAVQTVIASYQQGGRLYIAGNGGSAADAQHLAAEFVSRLSQNRAPLPAEALTVDSSVLTAIGNDYGFDCIFSRQLMAKANSNDVFLGITTSGRSLNIIKALEQCNCLGIPSIVFCGRDGGAVKSLANFCILTPGNTTSTIQELHIVLAHTLCECVELALFSNDVSSVMHSKTERIMPAIME